MYGPTPGGGLFASLCIGVPAGTSPRAGSPSTFSNAPYGWVRWTTILRVASFVWIPEIVFPLPAAYAPAPTTRGVMNWPDPPHGIFTARSNAYVKSEATAGLPLE